MARVSGGDNIKSKLKNIIQKLSKARIVRVGFLENSRYPDGTSVPMVAAANEYGSPKNHRPPRPFFREMVKEKSPDWPEAIAEVLRDTDYDARKTLVKIGMAVKGQLQEKIVQYVGPPLAPSTILRKSRGMSKRRLAAAKAAGSGPYKQLIDTGYMLQSVDYSVKE